MELDTDIFKIVNLDLFCCEKAVAPPNKKIIIMRRIIMEIFGYDAISSKCYKLPRQIFASSLKNPWHNLATFTNIQTRFSAGLKVNKEV